MFGLTIEKLLIIGVIAAFLVGPDKLPIYAGKLGELVRRLRSMTDGAKDRMRDEMGSEFDEVDWKKLDPRQYDPRRIIREALIDTDVMAPAVATAGSAALGANAPAREVNQNSAYMRHKRRNAEMLDGPVPFDTEAT